MTMERVRQRRPGWWKAGVAAAGGGRSHAGQVEMGKAVKPVDAWWTVLAIDPIAVRLLPFLLPFGWITANAVTGLAFVVGGGAVALFATGHFVAGAVLYELRFLLDCLDGKIARLRGTSSPLGAAFDRTADALTVPAAYAAIGVVLAHLGHLPAVLALAPALCSTALTVLELSLELLLLRSAGSRSPARSTASPSTPPSVAADAGTDGHGVAAAGKVASWMRRRRLRFLPWTVEMETVGLFLGPLLLRGAALGNLELAVAAVYLLGAVFDVGQIGRAAAG